MVGLVATELLVGAQSKTERTGSEDPEMRGDTNSTRRKSIEAASRGWMPRKTKASREG
jgi:hypothetical protein